MKYVSKQSKQNVDAKFDIIGYFKHTAKQKGIE